MAKKTRQAYQYEAPVTPSKWTGEEQRFSIRVKAVLEDLYQKFGSLSTKASGAGSVESVNGITPDEEGNVTLTAEDVGAKPASYKAPVDSVNGKTGAVQLTALDVSARPSDWMPTASDVGALPVSGTAADSEKLGGKSPEYYTQPRNLLDNSDFRNPVNQRGQTSYNGVGNRDVYTIDRWLFSWQAGAVLTVGNGYIQKNNLPLIQRLDNIDLNKTYTLALCFANGDKKVFSGTFSEHFGDFDNFIWGGKDGDIPQVRIAPPVVDPIIWAALYEGEYTAETLPPYVPKGYGIELVECQRYYWESKMVYAAKENYARWILICNVKFPQKMRIDRPTITIKSPNGTPNRIATWTNLTELNHDAIVNDGSLSAEGFNSIRMPSEVLDDGTIYAFKAVASADL